MASLAISHSQFHLIVSRLLLSFKSLSLKCPPFAASRLSLRRPFTFHACLTDAHPIAMVVLRPRSTVTVLVLLGRPVWSKAVFSSQNYLAAGGGRCPVGCEVSGYDAATWTRCHSIHRALACDDKPKFLGFSIFAPMKHGTGLERNRQAGAWLKWTNETSFVFKRAENLHGALKRVPVSS